jgi:hypothetical protein
MFGNVNSSKVLRPNVSIVQIAGLQNGRLACVLPYKACANHQAKTKLTRPNPNEAIRASFSVAPAARKTVDE